MARNYKTTAWREPDTNSVRRAPALFMALLLAASVLVVVGTPVASATEETGGHLAQKPAPAGCVSDTGSGGTCADGRKLNQARDVATSPDGKNVYAVAQSDDAVLIFDRDPTTGALTQKAGLPGCITDAGEPGSCVDGVALLNPFSITVSPLGKNVYVGTSTSDSVAVFDRDATTGELTQKAGTAGCVSETGTGGLCAAGDGLDAVSSVVVSPDGSNVYTTSRNDDAVAVFDRDAAGVLTQKAGTAGCVSDTGNGGACVDGTALDVLVAVVVSPDGNNAYVGSESSDAVAVFDRAATGALTQKAGTAGCVSDTGSGGECVDGTALNVVSSVAVSPEGKNLYVGTRGDDSVAVFDRDATTGAIVQKPGTAGCIRTDANPGPCTPARAVHDVFDVVVSPDGASVYSADRILGRIAILERDLASGVLSQRAGVERCINHGSTINCQDGVNMRGLAALAVSADGQNVYGAAAESSDAVDIFDRTPCADHPFTDVPIWVDPAVDWAFCGQFLSGFADSTFRVNVSMTRGQVARLLYRVEGFPPVDGLDPHGFSDVNPFFEDAVRWLAHNGFATGFPDGTFRPNASITRAEVSRMQFRIKGSPAGAPAHPFTDVPPWVASAVDWIADPANVPSFATGFPDGSFRPNIDITRGQVTRMTCRINNPPGTC